MNKRVFAGVAALAMIFSVACSGDTDGGGGRNDKGGNGSDVTDPNNTAESTVYVEYSPLNDAVTKFVDQLPDIEVTKKLKWLAWFEIDETQPTAVLFKQKYGVPESEKDPENPKVIEYRKVTYDQRFEELGKEIAAGDSPDLFQFDVTNYPYCIYVNMFQSVDDLFDFSAPEWQSTAEARALFDWGGKTYCPITELVPSYLMWYRKSVIEEAGLPDPYMLYKSGQWDWNSFLEICEGFSDPDNEKYVISGWNPDNAFLCTTGKGLITIENGKLVNNMHDARIERCMDMLLTLAQRNYRYPHHELNNWGMNYPEFASGNILFWDNGQWWFEDLLYKYRDRYGWDDDELCFVPYPRDPEADKYYQMMKQDSYMLPSGSTNKEGYKAWLTCSVLTTNDPEVRSFYLEKRKQPYGEGGYGWTDFQLELLDEIVRDLTPVFDFKNGIGEDVADTNEYESAMERVTKYVYIHGNSYTQSRAENEAVINSRLEELNKSVS